MMYITIVFQTNAEGIANIPIKIPDNNIPLLPSIITRIDILQPC